jgi:hypothetical protein
LASVLFAPHVLDDPSLPWLKINWIQTPPSLAIPKSLEILGIGGHAGFVLALVKQFRFIEFPRWLEFLGVAALFSLLLYSAVPWGDDRLGIPRLWKRKAWLWTTLLFPLVTMWLVSYFASPMYVVGRYDLVVFPAYALLIGLACAKLQRSRGVLLAGCAACVLCIPLVTKLYLYYHVPDIPAAKQNAAFLDLAVSNNDVVVFTGVRGQLLLYYLGRLGYRWESGICRNDIMSRRFYCRFIPRENERTQLVMVRPAGSSLQPLVDELAAVTGDLSPSTGTLWLVFQSLGSMHPGVVRLDPDERLIEGVGTLGYRMVPELSRAGIYAFHRPSGKE